MLALLRRDATVSNVLVSDFIHVSTGIDRQNIVKGVMRAHPDKDYINKYDCKYRHTTQSKGRAGRLINRRSSLTRQVSKWNLST
jgi:hypothetical protein